MNSLVSVIIPVYNTEKYLSHCLESVISQTYSNLEIILIDDGSSDKSGCICDQYAQKDQRIKVYHNKNQGLGLSRNVGIENSHGDYFMFIDSDDYIASHMIEDLLEIGIKNQADLCISGYRTVADHGKILSVKKYEKQIFEDDQARNHLLPRTIGGLPDQDDVIYSMVWGKLYAADIIRNHHILFHSERIILAEDRVFQLDYLPFIKKAVITDRCYYYYRKNAQSLSSKHQDHLFEKFIKFYKYEVDQIRRLDLPEEALWRADWTFLMDVLACLRNELPQYSQNSLKECYEKVKKIVYRDILQEIIAQYPAEYLNGKGKVYCFMLKNKLCLLLIIMLEVLN